MACCIPKINNVPSDLGMRQAAPGHRTFHSRSFPNPFKRIESLRPALRFRVFLGADDANELEVVR